MSKPTPTKTTNPIHFEDLDPKRFEDLVRELIYDFKEWRTIEATGKGGADDGFDIRAIERLGETVLDDDCVETVHPMDGNLWMIQCKREKSIGPTKLKQILADIDPKEPPYGYILAASVNFSKKAYDAFREELRARGVMEFYLWGKPELEALLHQPKNDRILFTFFGISNVSRRRSRATEIRFGVTNKNRIMRAFGENPDYAKILVRDSKDTKYPYSGGYPDFEERPRWKEYRVVGYHPLGLVVKVKHQYAFYDADAGTFDVAEHGSLIFRDSDPDDRRREQSEQNELVRDFWENLPRKNQAEFQLNGLLSYDSMLVIDDKGDNWNDFPHVFIDFVGGNGPIKGYFDYLKVGPDQVSLEELKEVKRFPDKFPKPTFGTIYEQEPLPLMDGLAEQFLSYREGFDTLYDLDGIFDHLVERDIGLVRKEGKEDGYLQVTHKYKVKAGDLEKDQPHLMWNIERQAGRKPEESDMITFIEFRRAHEWQFRKSKS